ncbi:MAG: hypothetical protein U0325_02530 [Polyangiales bacterium]
MTAPTAAPWRPPPSPTRAPSAPPGTPSAETAAVPAAGLTGPASALPAVSPARAWAQLEQLRARLDAMVVGAPDAAISATHAAARQVLLLAEGGEILETAGFSEEPFASRFRAWQGSLDDGGRARPPRASYFLPEDDERLRIYDALDALRLAPEHGPRQRSTQDMGAPRFREPG